MFIYSNKQWHNITKEEYLSYKNRNPNDWWVEKDNDTNFEYEFVIQCIARNEELYFKEWIEHHLNLGVDFIYIYDNNDEDGLDVFLKHQLSDLYYKKVKIIPYREKMKCQQISALYDCVNQIKDKAKWMISLDLDEFLIIEKPLNVFLKEFAYASEIYLSWESLSADGQVKYENKPLLERFKKRFNCKDKGQGKIIFRPRRLKKWAIHSATLTGGKIVNAIHKEISPPDSYNVILKNAWIKHFFTKSLEEWVNKIKRGCCDNYFCRRYDLFFEINPELINYYDKNAQMIQLHSHAPENEIPML